ncbi:hypothetical protein GGX14DRAFT_395517 [Mycena pura]|uniref:Uncharacterized protein n=1 Tax=Mycena pura TaxID=153505 RepID=A0AAD6VCF1_9AGAR|nr:hypothetical protein GGX14DRAFT_395517 [Mycena pura]
MPGCDCRLQWCWDTSTPPERHHPALKQHVVGACVFRAVHHARVRYNLGASLTSEPREASRAQGLKLEAWGWLADSYKLVAQKEKKSGSQHFRNQLTYTASNAAPTAAYQPETHTVPLQPAARTCCHCPVPSGVVPNTRPSHALAIARPQTWLSAHAPGAGHDLMVQKSAGMHRVPSALPCCPPPAAAHCLLPAACCPLPPAPAACAHAAAPPLTCRPAICLPAAPLSTTRVQLPTPVAAASRPRQRSTSRSFPGSLEDRKSEGKLLLSLCKCAAKRAAKEVRIGSSKATRLRGYFDD